MIEEHMLQLPTHRAVDDDDYDFDAQGPRHIGETKNVIQNDPHYYK